MDSIITSKDLEAIAWELKKERSKDAIIKVQVNATANDILRICRDEPTHKHIDTIRSATIDIHGVRFELVKSKKNEKINLHSKHRSTR